MRGRYPLSFARTSCQLNAIPYTLLRVDFSSIPVPRFFGKSAATSKSCTGCLDFIQFWPIHTAAAVGLAVVGAEHSPPFGPNVIVRVFMYVRSLLLIIRNEFSTRNVRLDPSYSSTPGYDKGWIFR